jgi:exodeoxyribonuclease VII small subunit
MTKQVKFEEALSRLEEIVDKLQSRELLLEESLKLFEEGLKLSRFCYDKLQEAEKRVRELVADQEGSFQLKFFEEEETER